MKVRGLRWLMIGLVFLATVINYIDRQTLAVLKKTICDDLGISDTRYGLIFASFLLAYALSQTLSGRLYDIIGNVMEWTNDWFDAQYYNFIPQKNPKGPETGLYKSIRGGGWAEGRGMKLANFYRNYTDPELRFDTVGIRCAK